MLSTNSHKMITFDDDFTRSWFCFMRSDSLLYGSQVQVTTMEERVYLSPEDTRTLAAWLNDEMEEQ